MSEEYKVGEIVEAKTGEQERMEAIVSSLVEIELVDPDNFLKVRETLTRVGVASRHENTLFQSCHILHKRKKYYLVHFKELFKLDGKPTDITEDDLARRNAIANMLAQWNLIKIVDEEKTKKPEPAPISQIKVIKHGEKDQWNLKEKYHIGFTRKVM